LRQAGVFWKGLTVTTDYGATRTVTAVRTDTTQPFTIHHSPDGTNWVMHDTIVRPRGQPTGDAARDARLLLASAPASVNNPLPMRPPPPPPPPPPPALAGAGAVPLGDASTTVELVMFQARYTRMTWEVTRRVVGGHGPSNEREGGGIHAQFMGF
jgi:hypothetical protein